MLINCRHGERGREIIIFPNGKHLGNEERHGSIHAIVPQDIQSAGNTAMLLPNLEVEWLDLTNKFVITSPNSKK